MYKRQLRGTLTAAVQFGGNKEAAAEVARLLVSSEAGCLGARCSEILAAASADGATRSCPPRTPSTDSLLQ